MKEFLRGFGHFVGSIIAAMAIMVLVTLVTAGLDFPFGATAGMLFFIGYWAWRIFVKWPNPTHIPSNELCPTCRRANVREMEDKDGVNVACTRCGYVLTSAEEGTFRNTRRRADD